MKIIRTLLPLENRRISAELQIEFNRDDMELLHLNSGSMNVRVSAEKNSVILKDYKTNFRVGRHGVSDIYDIALELEIDPADGKIKEFITPEKETVWRSELYYLHGTCSARDLHKLQDEIIDELTMKMARMHTIRESMPSDSFCGWQREIEIDYT